jgi:dihydroneopterin aldolase
MRALATLARTRHVLVVPGGGRFADLVRREMPRLGLSEARAHAMALLAMDQYALVLAGATPRARPVATLGAARRAAAAGRLPILLASRIAAEERGGLGGHAGRRAGGARRAVLERTFRTTSDAIAGWVASRLRARALVLLKSVPGLDLAIAGRRDAGRAARRGLVDARFAHHLPRGARVRLVDGRADDLGADLSRWLRSAAPPSAMPPGSRAPAPGRAAPGVRRRTARRGPR